MDPFNQSTINCSSSSFSVFPDGLLASSSSSNFSDDDALLLRSVESSWRDAQLHPSLMVDRVVTPVWYVVGIVGNLASARIWLGRRLRRNNSSAIYLATLSINDTLFLVLHVCQELKYAWSLRTVDYPVVCELYALVYLVTQYMAPILVLGFTVERFIAICYPYQKNRYCTASRAVKVIIGMIVVCFMIGSVQPYLWTYDAASGQCTVRNDAESGGPVSLWNVWSWSTELLVFLIVPLVILAVNVLVMREVWRMSAADPVVVLGGGNNSVSSGRSSASPGSPAGGSVGHRPPSYDLQQLQQQQPSPSPPPPQQQQQHRNAHQIQRISHQLQQLRQKYHQQQHRHPSHHHGASNSAATNAMLLSVSFYVIFTTLPATLVYVLATAFPEGHVRASLVHRTVATSTADNSTLAAASVDPCGPATAAAAAAVLTAATIVVTADEIWTRFVAFATVRNIVNEICLSHYACNFFLFVATGREFRAVVRRTFCCRAAPSAGTESSGLDSTLRQSQFSTVDHVTGGGSGRQPRVTSSVGAERALLTAV